MFHQSINQSINLMDEQNQSKKQKTKNWIKVVVVVTRIVRCVCVCGFACCSPPSPFHLPPLGDTGCNFFFFIKGDNFDDIWKKKEWLFLFDLVHVCVCEWMDDVWKLDFFFWIFLVKTKNSPKCCCCCCWSFDDDDDDDVEKNPTVRLIKLFWFLSSSTTGWMNLKRNWRKKRKKWLGFKGLWKTAKNKQKKLT